jgi:hypothetical protein
VLYPLVSGVLLIAGSVILYNMGHGEGDGLMASLLYGIRLNVIFT